ncbi:MAG: hypothetical protein L3J93_01485 [Thermoplasmata archaeon]|nr:hypothetical protein [Thermoplasmata archaeon]
MRKAYPILVVVLAILFLVSFPGFGIETRSYASYAAWAGPIFLILSLLIFASGIVGLLLHWRGSTKAPYFGMVMAGAAIATILLDISHVGGLPPPTGPLILSGIGLVLAVVLLWVSYSEYCWQDCDECKDDAAAPSAPSA